MPGNRFNAFQDHGVGIGLRIPHYQHIFSRKPVVDWFEIISENFMIDAGRPLAMLDQILEQYRVVQHGVSMYFGSVTAPDPEHLRRLKQLVAPHQDSLAQRPSLLGLVSTAPTPTTCCRCPTPGRPSSAPSSACAWCRTISRFPSPSKMSAATRPSPAREMTEWEFLTEVVERADCGILLDVNNIYVSAMNHEFNPMDYVNAVPAHRVAQIHIAGHSKYEKYILDTHDHPVIDPVWQLYARAIERCGPTPTLLEWDDHIPSFDEVHAEAKKAERYLHRQQNRKSRRPCDESRTHEPRRILPLCSARWPQPSCSRSPRTKRCVRPRPTAAP